MKVSRARQIAFEILRRVEEGAYAGELLHARLGEGVSAEDAGLATELVMGTLRWRRSLDFLIERQTGTRTERLDVEVLVALRLGLYQMRFLTRVPARAAVNESVELVKAARKKSAAGLVNAVLRRVEARAEVEKLLPMELPVVERMGILGSHPTWLVERWLKNFGEEKTRGLLEANNRAARRTVYLPSNLQAREGMKPGRWLRQAADVAGEAGEELRGQDEASQMVARLMDVKEGQRVLDVCAAPGGKMMMLAESAGPKGLVVACDLHAHRLRAMRVPRGEEKKWSARVVRVALDATTELPFAQKFDHVLVDAPCSGTGTLARNPEIRWRLTAGDLLDLHAKQVALLRQAMEAVAPGGRLVYSTCSLEPEENEEVVRVAMEGRNDFVRVSGAGALKPHLRQEARVGELFDERGDFRTFPPEHGTDGFYAAVMERLG